jgi:hypothetical protein
MGAAARNCTVVPPCAGIRGQSNSPTLLIAACIIIAAVLGCGPIRNLDAHVSNGE